MIKYFSKISVVLFPVTSPHYPFTFSWEIGLIRTNCLATAKPIVLPVALERVLHAAWLEQYGEQRIKGQWNTWFQELYFSLTP